MLLKLIDDMNKALDNDCFFSALSLALTLPDICGMAKYPNKKVGERYIDWYDEYIGQYEKSPEEENREQTPYLSGEVVYRLRCCFLHQGNPNIDKDKIKEERCKIDRFVLMTEKKKDFNILADVAFTVGDESTGGAHRTFFVNVRRLCFIISTCAKAYYNECPEKFDFWNFEVVDVDEMASKIKSKFTQG